MIEDVKQIVIEINISILRFLSSWQEFYVVLVDFDIIGMSIRMVSWEECRHPTYIVNVPSFYTHFL